MKANASITRDRQLSWSATTNTVSDWPFNGRVLRQGSLTLVIILTLIVAGCDDDSASDSGSGPETHQIMTGTRPMVQWVPTPYGPRQVVTQVPVYREVTTQVGGGGSGGGSVSTVGGGGACNGTSRSYHQEFRYVADQWGRVIKVPVPVSSPCGS
jgi:hypothetical protein